ncbi:MAG: GtrA family protein [Acidobacteria bacterium]|nr:GtrA family protein [Acidobacteriota bacterium]
MTGRATRFVAVGTVGFFLQMAAAAILLCFGVRPVLATVLAIEAAILSNHAMHRRWTWRDRSTRRPWTTTLRRAHVGAGATSLIVGAGTVLLLADRVAPMAAQVLAVLLCAAANYWLADRWIFATSGAGRRGAWLLPVCLLGMPSLALADGPSREAIASWDRYVSVLERARERDDAAGVPAWATDDDRGGVRVRRALAGGAIDVTRRRIESVAVDDATIEHWQGSVLLRGATLEQVSKRLRHPERFPRPRDVMALRVSHWNEDGHELFLRIRRSWLVSATYDTWHAVRHRTRSTTRVDSTSVATRIDEVRDAGTATERRASPADERGFLWRMQSSWRFAAVPEGVIVTCESITLSRPVPTGLGPIARPIVTRIARESMTTAIASWRS